MAWKVQIDWDRDSNFTGTYDDITEYVLNAEWELGCRPYELVADEATARITVTNIDKRFSPENSSSPLYGSMVPNLPVRIMLDDTVLWSGLTGSFKPDPFQFDKRQAIIECTGIKTLLERFELYVDLYENVTADEVIQDIITQIVQPPASVGLWLLGVAGYSELGVSTYLGDISEIAELDTGITEFAYAGDNIQESEKRLNAYEVIRQLVEAERGRFFIGRDGKAVFWNRYALLNDGTVDATINDTAADMKYLTQFEANELVNRVEVTVYPREEGASSTDLVWDLGTSVTLGAYEAKTIYAPYRDENGRFLAVKNLQTPAGGDISIDAGGVVEVEGKGQRARVTITNNTANEITLSTLKLRGKKVTSTYPIMVEAQDETSMATYGTKSINFDLKMLDDISTAEGLALFELRRRSSISGRVDSVTLEEQIEAETDGQIQYGIGDLVRVVDTQTSHDENYHIVGERHKLDASADRRHWLVSEWLLEPASIAPFWALGVAGFSELGVTTVLCY